MNAEKIALYEATVARLEAQLVSLRGGRRRLQSILVATAVLAILSVFVKVWAPILVLVAGLSVYGVAHYILLMHITEDTAAIAAARATIADLSREPPESRA